MKLLFLLLFFFVFENCIFAQGKPDKLIVIVLTQDSMKVQGATVKVNQSGNEFTTMTSNEGEALIAIDRDSAFTLKVSHVGFDSVIKKIDPLFNQRLLKVTLTPKSKELKAVTVIAEKPFISIDKNKIILSIDKNKVAGQSVVDILKKAPGITVQNNIILFEGKPITALMKGKTIKLSASNLTDFMEGTSASAIQEIEIITVPLANTDASVTGAMINLKPVTIVENGFKSNVNFRVGSRSKFGNGGASAWINFKHNKLSGFASFGYSKDYQNNENKIQRSYIPTNNNHTISIDEISRGKYTPVSTPLSISLEYEINKKNQLGTILYGMFSNPKIEQNSSSSIFTHSPISPADSLITMASDENTKNRIGSIDLFYKLKLDSSGQELNFDAAYSKIHGDNDNGQRYNYYLDDGSSYQMPSYLDQATLLDLTTKSIQVDYIKPFKKVKLESGLKQGWTSVNQILDQTITRQNEPSHLNDSLIYDENIFAGYITLSGSLATVAYSIGVRGENTSIKSSSVDIYESLKRNYFKIFPTLLFSKKIGNHSLSLSYKKSIERPIFSKLTNFKYYISPFFYYTGNPTLQPYFQNAVRLAWTIKNKFQLTGTYTWFRDNMLEYAELDTINNITKGLIANNGSLKSASLNPNYFDNITRWWYTNTGFRINLRYLDFISNQQPVNINNLNFSFNTSNTFTISKSIKCELYGYYSSAVNYNATKTGSYWFIDLSVYKNILKGSGQLSLSINDIFYTNITKSIANYALVNYVSTNRWDSRNIVLGFNYSFGSKKYKFRPLKRSSATDDIRSRSN